MQPSPRSPDGRHGLAALLGLLALACRPPAPVAPAATVQPVATATPAARAEPAAALAPAAPERLSPAAPPATLAATGLYADASLERVAEGVRPFAPRYPLWSDGAAKRRWILLPPGAAIDASEAQAWRFPAGTKLWKEFRFGRRVETRTLERAADGTWLFATYLWPEDGGDARLAPELGVRGACETGLGKRHDVPSRGDCVACHEGEPGVVLGFSALQLGPERDPLAPHAEEPEPGSIDLSGLLAEGLLRGSREALLAAGAPIEARSERERAALGTLHANCGGCHNAAGPLASLGLELAYRREATAPAIRSALGRASRFQPTGWEGAPRIAPGDPDHSVVVARMASRFAATQMPPLGTHAIDASALALVRDWIRIDLAQGPTVAAAGELLPRTLERHP